MIKVAVSLILLLAVQAKASTQLPSDIFVTPKSAKANIALPPLTAEPINKDVSELSAKPTLFDLKSFNLPEEDIIKILDFSPKNENLAKSYFNLLSQKTINPVAIYNAYKFYEENHEKNQLSQDFLVIVDYTKSAELNRYFWINLPKGKIIYSFRVAHGKNSGKGYFATKCSGINDSLTTPCGFHKYGIPYISGRNGLSIKMYGLQEINSLSELPRHIVAHPAAYVKGSLLLGKESYSRWVLNSSHLYKALIDNKTELFEKTYQSFTSLTKPVPAINELSVDNSDGCHAMGAEDFVKIVPLMKDVMSYNFFGEGLEGPTQLVFDMPLNYQTAAKNQTPSI